MITRYKAVTKSNNNDDSHGHMTQTMLRQFLLIKPRENPILLCESKSLKKNNDFKSFKKYL